MTEDKTLQLRLVELNKRRLLPSLPDETATKLLDVEVAEEEFLSGLRDDVSHLAHYATRDVKGFVDWFEELRHSGPHAAAQRVLFDDYIANVIPLERMRWFVAQEVAGEAGFDDLVALTQLRMPTAVKLELARNYWDEMGRGRERAIHGPMLHNLAKTLGVHDTPPENVVSEALAVGNTLAGLAYNRRYAWHSFGALGAVELTAPDRATHVVAGLRRLGVSDKASSYFELHASIDKKHWAGWRDKALVPLLKAKPEVAWAIAEGAFMRLEVGRRSFERYMQVFGLELSNVQVPA